MHGAVVSIVHGAMCAQRIRIIIPLDIAIDFSQVISIFTRTDLKVRFTQHEMDDHKKVAILSLKFKQMYITYRKHAVSVWKRAIYSV